MKANELMNEIKLRKSDLFDKENGFSKNISDLRYCLNMAVEQHLVSNGMKIRCVQLWTSKPTTFAIKTYYHNRWETLATIQLKYGKASNKNMWGETVYYIKGFEFLEGNIDIENAYNDIQGNAKDDDNRIFELLKSKGIDYKTYVEIGRYFKANEYNEFVIEVMEQLG